MRTEMSEMAAVVRVGLERGWIKPAAAPVFTGAPKDRESRRRERRGYFAAGLTARGTVRKRSYMFLGGMSEEQKEERQREQKRAWNERRKNLTQRRKDAEKGAKG